MTFPICKWKLVVLTMNDYSVNYQEKQAWFNSMKCGTNVKIIIYVLKNKTFTLRQTSESFDKQFDLSFLVTQSVGIVIHTECTY